METRVAVAILLKNQLVDALVSWEMGVDTYRSPARVPRNQLCLSINNTTRQDFIGVRSAWTQVPLQFVKLDAGSGQIVPDSALQTAFETGFFQKFSGYVPDQGDSHLLFCVGGRLYKVEPFRRGIVEALAMPGPWPDAAPSIYMVQAEMFIVIRDGKSVPIIYDGGRLRFSDVEGVSGTDADGHPLLEVPPGGPMAYSEGRLWVALENGIGFVAGDAVYDPTGTAQYAFRDALLRFTSNTYLNEGGAFPVPASMGGITAMVVMANLDTSLGQGPLQVFTPQGAFSVSAPFDRTLWKAVSSPIKTTSLFNAGALGDGAAINVNGDVWFRSARGVESFLIARRDFGTWGNRAMSYEVLRHLQGDNPDWLYRASAALFDNRLLVTCAPRWDPAHGIFHAGLVVLDFLPITTIGSAVISLLQPPPNPVWDGMWTGLDIQQIAVVKNQGVDHCYAAVLGQPDGMGVRHLQLWELTRVQGNDNALGVESRAQRVVETPRVAGEPASNRLEQKLLVGADVWHDQAQGTVDLTLFYRPDENPCWYLWKHWQICAPVKACATDAVEGCMSAALNRQPQYRPRVGALKPPEALTANGTPARLGYAFQFRLEIQGVIEITAMRFLYERVLEATFGAPSPGVALCSEVVQCCPPSDFVPSTPAPS